MLLHMFVCNSVINHLERFVMRRLHNRDLLMQWIPPTTYSSLSVQQTVLAARLNLFLPPHVPSESDKTLGRKKGPATFTVEHSALL